MSVGRIVLAWGACAGLYLLLAGQVGGIEAGVAVAAGGLGAGWYALTQRCAAQRFVFSREHLRPWWRAVAGLPAATLRTAGALLRAATTGAAADIAVEPAFAAGAAADPRDAARRASAFLAASLSPDSFVVDARPGRATALVHALVPPAPSDPRWLV